MRKLLLIIVPIVSVGLRAHAQVIVTEMDRVTFYNSLDSATGAAFNKIAWLCNCYLLKNYPKSTVPVKLDMELSKDTAVYEVGYDNLYGNTGFPDTTGQGQNLTDKIYFDTGLRIRACDTALNAGHILKLLDWGLQHYEELKIMRAEALAMALPARPRHCSIDEGTLRAILARRTPLKMKEAIRWCR